jgi:hypothetical protein
LKPALRLSSFKAGCKPALRFDGGSTPPRAGLAGLGLRTRFGLSFRLGPGLGCGGVGKSETAAASAAGSSAEIGGSASVAAIGSATFRDFTGRGFDARARRFTDFLALDGAAVGATATKGACETAAVAGSGNGATDVLRLLRDLDLARRGGGRSGATLTATGFVRFAVAFSSGWRGFLAALLRGVRLADVTRREGLPARAEAGLRAAESRGVGGRFLPRFLALPPFVRARVVLICSRPLLPVFSHDRREGRAIALPPVHGRKLSCARSRGNRIRRRQPRGQKRACSPKTPWFSFHAHTRGKLRRLSSRTHAAKSCVVSSHGRHDMNRTVNQQQ